MIHNTEDDTHNTYNAIRYIPYCIIQYIVNHRINTIPYNKRQGIQYVQDNERQNTI